MNQDSDGRSPTVLSPDGGALSERRQTAGLMDFLHPRVIITLSLLLPITWLLFELAKRSSQAVARQRFEHVAQLEASALDERLAQLEAVLSSGASQVDFEAADAGRRLRQFAGPFSRSFAGLSAVGFCRWIGGEERESVVASMRGEGDQSFELLPRGERREYASVLWVEPQDGINQRTIGYDYWTEPVRRLAMTRARDTGTVALSGLLGMSQESGAVLKKGVMLFAPVYRRDKPIHSVEQRVAANLGWCFAFLQVSELRKREVGAAPRLLWYSVHAGVDPSVDNCLSEGTDGVSARDRAQSGRYVHRIALEHGGQLWTLVFHSLPPFEQANRDFLPWLVLLLLAVFDLTALVVVARIGNFRGRVGREVELRVAEIRRSEEKFQRASRDMAALCEGLRSSDEYQRSIIAASGYAIIATDPKGVIRTFNPAAERMLGYKAEELVGKSTPAPFHLADEVAARAQQFSKELDVLVEPGFEVFVARCRRRMPNEFEWTYVRKDGSRLPVTLSVTALSDASNRITGFLGVAVDIREFKKSEARLIAAMRENKDLKTALEAHAIVEISDRLGRIKYVNDNFCALTKYSRGEVLGQTYKLFSSGYHTKDYFRDMYATLNRAQIWHGEMRNRAKDGSIYWVDTTIVPFLDEKGVVQEYITIRMDITARKKAEKQQLAMEALLRQFVVYVPAAVAMLDDRMCFLHVSERWLIDFGLVDKEVVGSLLASHPRLPASWTDAFPQVMAGKVLNQLEQKFETSDGRTVMLQWEARPWRRTDATVGGVMLFSQLLGSDAARAVFPVDRGHSQTPDQEPPAEEHVEAQKSCVLVIEDEATVASWIRTELERAGCVVLLARDPLAAFALWQHERYRVDLVVTEFILTSESNGADLLARFRLDRPDLKGIIISGYGIDVLGAETALLHGDHFLQKPFSPDALIGLVRSCLRD